MQNSNDYSNKIRETFLNFFKKNSHSEIESSSLIPNDDSTLLFVNSGMVQFKKWFTGEEKPKNKNVVSIQKCLRAGGKHNDLENVGLTPRHHTFFEMLGNFSFGGYFKEEAIKLAWDLLTKEYSIDEKRLIITVYKEDELSFKIWKKISGFNDEKIIRISSNDNFWSMGDSGPCGPCSEIFFDNGESIKGGLPGTKNQDGERFVEIWNLVFMEYEKKGDSLETLPGKFVDTGMGLERILAVLNGKVNNYDTDLFEYVFKRIEEETKTNLNKNLLIPFRIISDHLKSIIFMMSEGILPSNEGRGYVLRRIIRRALLNVNKLNPDVIILNRLVDDVINKYRKPYYELTKAELFIKDNLKNEEEKFSETLSIGLELLNKEIKKNKTKEFKPEIAFKLYDTYGFPVDMTESILNDRKLSLDIKKYKSIVEAHKKLQNKTWVGIGNKDNEKNYQEIFKNFPCTQFCGYGTTACNSKLLNIIENDMLVDSTKKNEEVMLIFDKTPFYAEAGGQLGDSGNIYNSKRQIVAEISDTKKIKNGIYLHFVNLCLSELKKNESYFLEIDKDKRVKTSNNHSATHLLHESLRQIVGKHVSQKGSLVSSKKLRFDYSSNEQLSLEKIKKIEILVNNSIRSNIGVEINQMSLDKALKLGAIALFGEKYPNKVRVVSMKSKFKDEQTLTSIELCGGTHVKQTGQIGFLKILSDISVSSGVRRIEALTGQDAHDYIDDKINSLVEIKNILKASDENVVEKIKNLKNSSTNKIKISNEIKYSNLKIISAKEFKIYFDNIDCHSKELKNNSDLIKKQFKSGIIILTSQEDNKVSVVVSITENLLGKFDSSIIIKKIITYLGGKGGGGRKDLSQGGAPLNEKFKKLKNNLQKIIV